MSARQHTLDRATDLENMHTDRQAGWIVGWFDGWMVGCAVVPVRGRLNLKTLANTYTSTYAWRNIRYEHEPMHFTYLASSSSLSAAAGRTICVAAVALAAAAAAVAAAGPRLTTGG